MSIPEGWQPTWDERTTRLQLDKHKGRFEYLSEEQAKEIEDINAMEEKAEDLLHSDMIGAEVLRQISEIAKQSKIAITIPQDTIKSLPNG